MIEPEVNRVIARYARRSAHLSERYSSLNPAVLNVLQERQRALIGIFGQFLARPVETATLLEIGCGSGGNLLEFLRMGFRPENLLGNELLPERIQAARHVLPEALRLIPGDATALPLAEGSFDIVYQSGVFTSILDDAFRHKLASQMWAWAKPGGGVLWYDFTYNNPANPDVRGIKLSAVRTLFPHGKLTAKRVTLAPPISRLICRLHPAAYQWANVLPFLRTHILCWIGKSI